MRAASSAWRGSSTSGNHGLELDPRAAELAGEIRRFREAVGLPVEDKTLSLSYHYREAEDEERARAELEAVAVKAQAAGLDARWGRKVLEIRPPVPADKGTAIRALLERSGARRGLYAGDDTTDLDAFVGLVTAGLDHAVRVAVTSDEGPGRAHGGRRPRRARPAGAGRAPTPPVGAPRRGGRRNDSFRQRVFPLMTDNFHRPRTSSAGSAERSSTGWRTPSSGRRASDSLAGWPQEHTRRRAPARPPRAGVVRRPPGRPGRRGDAAHHPWQSPSRP